MAVALLAAGIAVVYLLRRRGKKAGTALGLVLLLGGLGVATLGGPSDPAQAAPTSCSATAIATDTATTDPTEPQITVTPTTDPAPSAAPTVTVAPTTPDSPTPTPTPTVGSTDTGEWNYIYVYGGHESTNFTVSIVRVWDASERCINATTPLDDAKIASPGNTAGSPADLAVLQVGVVWRHSPDCDLSTNPPTLHWVLTIHTVGHLENEIASTWDIRFTAGNPSYTVASPVGDQLKGTFTQCDTCSSKITTNDADYEHQTLQYFDPQ
jgi:hypothetical protein